MKETEIRRGRREDAAMKGGGKGKGTEPRRARLYLLPEGDVVLVQLADERGDAANEVRKDGRGEEHDADGEVALALRGGHDVTCATWQRGREVRGGVRAGGSPKDAPNVAREKLFEPSANPQTTSVTHAPPPLPPTPIVACAVTTQLRHWPPPTTPTAPWRHMRGKPRQRGGAPALQQWTRDSRCSRCSHCGVVYAHRIRWCPAS